ncbi:MAG: two-component system, OmpR family, sensor kinase [Ilumatobacteraceae bacterium]
MSLRIRLLVVSLALLVAGLTAAGLVSYSSLSSFLHARTDTQLDSAVGNVRHVLAALPAGETIQRQDLGAAAPGLWVQLRDKDGATLWEIQGYAWTAKPLTPQMPAALPPLREVDNYLGPSALFSTPAVENSGVQFRMIVSSTPTGQTVVVGASMQDTQRTLNRLVMVEVIGGALILLVAAIAGTWLMRLGLRPLVKMEAAAESIAEENLGQRLPGDQSKTEIGRLAGVLNTMLSRLEVAFTERRESEERLRRSEERLRRFAADASHELRTPIAAVRAHAELYQRRGDKAGDAAPVMAKIEQEATRLTRLVDDLLLLARLDEGQPLAAQPVDLGALVVDAVDAARTLDPGRAVELSVAGSVEVRGDRDRLRQVIDNLLTNVRLHTPPGTPASVSVVATNTEAVIGIADSGPGLSDDDRARVFERFYRADPSRARDSGGTGLGLSIVVAILTAHGGTVGVEPRPGGGTVFRARLPLLGEAN